MDPRSSLGAVMLVAAGLSVAAGSSAFAGGGHGGAPFHPGAGAHGGGFHGLGAGFHGNGGFGHVPPVSGVIHERAGMRPYLSAYGHTNTAVPRIVFDRTGSFHPGGTGYGHYGTAVTSGGDGRWRGAAYGHTGAVFRPGLSTADRGADREARRHDVRDRPFGAGRGRFSFGRVAGGYGGGYGYAGGAAAGTYGSQGTYGVEGTYGGQGTYGTEGTYGTPRIYGDGEDVEPGQDLSYLSEAPLAARFAEPPLAPSPYGFANSYAYAASEDVDRRGRLGIVRVNRTQASGCGCDPQSRATPVVYRYGVGTAY